MNKKEKIISGLCVGSKTKNCGSFKSKKIQKHWVRNKNFGKDIVTDFPKGTDFSEINVTDKFISEDIDFQKSINSANETTMDYLLKHDTTSQRVKTTLERLASINKSKETGILFDSAGRKLITRDQARTERAKWEKELNDLRSSADTPPTPPIPPSTPTPPNADLKTPAESDTK